MLKNNDSARNPLLEFARLHADFKQQVQALGSMNIKQCHGEEIFVLWQVTGSISQFSSLPFGRTFIILSGEQLYSNTNQHRQNNGQLNLALHHS